jgi:hypothetical protein
MNSKYPNSPKTVQTFAGHSSLQVTMRLGAALATGPLWTSNVFYDVIRRAATSFPDLT